MPEMLSFPLILLPVALFFSQTFQVLYIQQFCLPQKVAVQCSHMSEIPVCRRQIIILATMVSKIGVYSSVSNTDSHLFTQTVEEFILCLRYYVIENISNSLIYNEDLFSLSWK